MSTKEGAARASERGEIAEARRRETLHLSRFADRNHDFMIANPGFSAPC